MDRVYYSAHAKYLGGIVCRLLQADGHRYHPVHHPGSARYPAFDAEATRADAQDGHSPEQAPRGPNPLRQRPHPHLPRDHADLQGRGHKPHRLPGSHGDSDADSLRVVSGPGPDSLRQTRRPGRALGKNLPLRTFFSCLLGRSAGRKFLVAGPVEPRLDQRGLTRAGIRDQLGPTEDDHAPPGGPAATGQPEHDAVDDAAAHRLLLFHLSQWTGLVLGSFQHHRYRHTILRNRLGPIVPAVLQARTGVNAGAACGKCGAQGDGRKWKYA